MRIELHNSDRSDIIKLMICTASAHVSVIESSSDTLHLWTSPTNKLSVIFGPAVAGIAGAATAATVTAAGAAAVADFGFPKSSSCSMAPRLPRSGS